MPRGHKAGKRRCVLVSKMSKQQQPPVPQHIKRLSVFDRLGPGAELDAQPVPPRHHHYPLDRHAGVDRSIHSLPIDDRGRDKKSGDLDAHKHHLTDPEVEKHLSRRSSRPSIVLANERGPKRMEHLYQSHTTGKRKHAPRGESASSSASGSMSDGEKDGEERRKRRKQEAVHSRQRPRQASGGDRREASDHGRVERGPDEQGKDHARGSDDRMRRKRDRERTSLGDDSVRPEAKRARVDSETSADSHIHSHSRSGELESSKPRHSREGRPSREHQSRDRRKYTDSVSDSDPGMSLEGSESTLDWTALSRVPLPLPATRLEASLARFQEGAIFSAVGSSISLSGKKLGCQIDKAVSDHLKGNYTSLLPETVLLQGFSRQQLACASVSYLNDQIQQAKILFDIGPCRRALTAQADYQMRKKLKNMDRNKLRCLPHAPRGSWDQELFATGLSLYQSLSKKAGSSKTSHRVSSSRLGTVLLPK